MLVIIYIENLEQIYYTIGNQQMVTALNNFPALGLLAIMHQKRAAALAGEVLS